ncbi:GyrI-like domain-containing protein [Peribacillus sp. SCS-155]|uniref:GyrI-like domain-containing protein n=1 Tax=Peribacillus sedimenti TaxID=3115297 RepID=UPI003906A216
MECKRVRKHFRMAGIRNSGAFTSFASEVPAAAQQFMKRSDEIQGGMSVEAALYEPKRDEKHLEGEYIVGLLVKEPLDDIPAGMEYIELKQDYIMTRGKMNEIASLHNDLVKWGEEQGYQRNLNSYIAETYHPAEKGGEEVEIYLPILSE